MDRGRILLADDNRLVVKVISEILGDAGYTVAVAWDGLEAINRTYREKPDLVILDIEMPKINGYQVCRLLKDDEYTREVPVVMLTARDQQSDVFWGLKTGADAYITKGFKPEQLLKVVEEQVDRGRGRAVEESEAEGPPVKTLDEAGVLGRVIELLDSRLFESTVLNELGALVDVSHDYRETLKSVLQIMARVVGNSVGMILLFDEEDAVVLVSRPVPGRSLEAVERYALETAASYGWEPPGPGRLTVTVFGEENLNRPGEAGEPALAHAHIPLSATRKVIGVLVLSDPAGPAFVMGARAILRLVQNQVTIVVDNARLYEAARQLAITDGLTKVCNHRFFQELFEQEFNRSDRYNTVFSLIMLDIDDFKQVNDTYGHLCGDEILKGIAGTARSCLRSMDVVARYGGEEFAILLPETNGPEAVRTAERIRRAIEGRTFVGADRGIRVTVSQGVASYPSDGVHERFDVIAKADEALYEAKAAGKNRVSYRE